MEKIVKFVNNEKKNSPLRKVIIFQDTLEYNYEPNVFNVTQITIEFEKDFKNNFIMQILEFEPDVIIWNIQNRELTNENINNINQINYRFPGPFKFLIINNYYVNDFDSSHIDFFLSGFNNEILEKIIKFEDLKKYK